MKKVLSLLLVLALVFSLAGCGSSAQPQLPQTEPSYTETTAPVHTPTEETQTQPTEQTPAPTTEPTQIPTTETKPAQKPTEPKPTVAPETEPTVPTTQPTEPAPTESVPPQTEPESEKSIDSKEEVALYIHLHGKLPSNYITKSQARKLGWKSGSVERYAPGKCIGGDRFMNREGLLPAGHTYYECDIDTLGKSSRGAKRLVYSSDGLIYYTNDHYESFTLLYGTP